jgi:hypothetical protein
VGKPCHTTHLFCERFIIKKLANFFVGLQKKLIKFQKLSQIALDTHHTDHHFKKEIQQKMFVNCNSNILSKFMKKNLLKKLFMSDFMFFNLFILPRLT